MLNIHADQIVGYVVDTGCSYFSSITFPDIVQVGMRVAKFSNSGVRYELAIFCNTDERTDAASPFVHLYVDRSDSRTAKSDDSS